MRKLFPGQQDDEQIILVVRQHWFFLFLRLCVWIIFAAVLIVLKNYGPAYFPSLFTANNVGYVEVFENIYVSVLALGLFMIWAIYYLNVQIITNKRVVDITQYSVYRQTISELLLPNVEDVTSDVTGFFGTMLEYGNILVQTAGEKDNFTFDNVPNARGVTKLISDLLEQTTQEQERGQQAPPNPPLGV